MLREVSNQDEQFEEEGQEGEYVEDDRQYDVEEDGDQEYGQQQEEQFE